MLLQIHEPGQTPEPHENQIKKAIGIDLGTTHTVVSIKSEEQGFQLIKTEDGNALLPSIVSFKDSDVIVGNKNLNNDTSSYTLSSIKRLMGKSLDDISEEATYFSFPLSHNDDTESTIRLQIGNRSITPIEVSAEILKQCKAMAEAHLGEQVSQAVITVPAYFDESARIATRQAAMLAGLDVLRLINEPTAAALAYGLDKGKEGLYAIYDLGGGTFDISLLKLRKGVFQVVATGGDTLLGGDDLDLAIAKALANDLFDTDLEAMELSIQDKQNLLSKSRALKEAFTDQKTVDFEIGIHEKNYKKSFNISWLNDIIDLVYKKTVSILNQVVSDAGFSYEDLDGIVFVGGSTKSPYLAEMVKKETGLEPLKDVDPDIVVAQGAAQQAFALTAGSNQLLLDVTPLSLGIELMGGIVEKIIDRNSPIPVSKSQEFTNYADGQSAMKIHILQGERETVDHCRSLGQLILRDIPPMPAGLARIKVTFTLDADGLLSVSAEEETTGKKQMVELKPTYGIDEAEMVQMLKDSIANAKEDMDTRFLIEARVEAKQILNELEKAYAESSDLLTDEDKETIEAAKIDLTKKMQTEDHEAIRDAVKHLDQASENFAQARMNKAFSEKLSGVEIEELKKSIE